MVSLATAPVPTDTTWLCGLYVSELINFLDTSAPFLYNILYVCVLHPFEPAWVIFCVPAGNDEVSWYCVENGIEPI